MVGHPSIPFQLDPIDSDLAPTPSEGEIYRMNLAGRSVVVLSSYALVNEACNEKRFRKQIRGVLNEVRAGVHDGLFTAKGPEEPNWGIAHRVLMPAFGPISINDMFDDMVSFASTSSPFLRQIPCQDVNTDCSWSILARHSESAGHEMGSIRSESSDYGYGRLHKTSPRYAGFVFHGLPVQLVLS